MNGSESGQQETMHNSRPIDDLSPTIHTPQSCLAIKCQITHQSYSLHASVSKLTVRSHKAIQAQLFTVLCIFVPMVQSSEATHAHCLFHVIKNLARARKKQGCGKTRRQRRRHLWHRSQAVRWHWLWLLESTQPRDLEQLLARALISAWTLPSATTCVQWVTSPRTTSSSIASA